MENDQHRKGLAVILNAFRTALDERGVEGSTVEYDFDGPSQQAATYRVTAHGKTEEQAFSREEIDDSGEAIDAPAAIKVRMLVSRFVR